MAHKHKWQLEGSYYRIINKLELNKYYKEWREWCNKSTGLSALFNDYKEPKYPGEKKKWYFKFVCECGASKLVKEK